MADIKWKSVVEKNGNVVSEKSLDIKDEWIDPILAYYGGYLWIVPNPDFDPEEEVTEENPREIPNPESRVDFFNRCVIETNKKDWKAFHEVMSQAAARTVSGEAFDSGVTTS